MNLDADVAMVYRIGPDLPSKIDTWRQHGYIIHLMTGVAWGQYQDYLDGKFDGSQHWDEAQTDSVGKPILHGGGEAIPCISPGLNYGRYPTAGFNAPWMPVRRPFICKSPSSGPRAAGSRTSSASGRRSMERRGGTREFLAGRAYSHCRQRRNNPSRRAPCRRRDWLGME